MFGSGNICGFSHENQTEVAQREIRNEFQSEAIYFENGTSCVVGDSVYTRGPVLRILFGYAGATRNTGNMASETNRCFHEDVRTRGKS